MNWNNKWEIETIISNYRHYFKAFADSGIINYQEGAVSWIMPAPGKKGAAMAFGIHLSEESADTELQEFIEGIRAKQIPQIWHITPDAEPENIVEIMKRYGFKNLSDNEPKPEPTMMLKKNEFKPCVNQNSGITCRRVENREDFRKWIDVVNTALHGWEMIDAENYYVWVENPNMAIYLGELNGIPVSTAASMCHGETASLEFVSTLEGYRRRGSALAVCSRALEELFADGVSNVTLGACGESARLYEKLGFRSYFNNVIMYYEGEEL